MDARSNHDFDSDRFLRDQEDAPLGPEWYFVCNDGDATKEGRQLRIMRTLTKVVRFLAGSRRNEMAGDFFSG
jgi:hypothetical protein